MLLIKGIMALSPFPQSLVMMLSFSPALKSRLSADGAVLLSVQSWGGTVISMMRNLGMTLRLSVFSGCVIVPLPPSSLGQLPCLLTTLHDQGTSHNFERIGTLQHFEPMIPQLMKHWQKMRISSRYTRRICSRPSQKIVCISL